MSPRRLRVSYRPTDSSVPLRRLAPMPFLRLQGRWLDRACFAVGADAQAQVKPGRLVIEVIDPQTNSV